MAFPTFGKKKEVAIPDDCFVEIIWNDNQNPNKLDNLKAIIDAIDQEVLVESPTMLADTLPYATFIQAEVLFTSIKQSFDSFQLKKVGICRRDNGKIVDDGEVYASPFVISQDYQDLLRPLMHAILYDDAFKMFTYAEKRDYFTDDIFPFYTRSLGVSSTQIPQFPSDDGSHKVEDSSEGMQDYQVIDDESVPKITNQTSIEPSKWQTKLTYGFGAVAVLGLVLSTVAISSLKDKNEKINYLHSQVEQLETVQKNEGKVDLFVRYLLPNLYSGDKKNLKDFLDSGNSKYTKAETGSILSVIQESVSVEDNVYHATYVVAISNGDDKTQSKRIELEFKADKKARFGFKLTEEPVIKDFE